ncbi:MAG: hypothetical protein IJ106_05450 [Parasporobacterium sp.]|nr:hypothetical protein [Parasporobacterium sp.]
MKYFRMIAAVLAGILLLTGPVCLAGEGGEYALPDFYVRVNPGHGASPLRNSASESAYQVAEIPEKTILHITDMAYEAGTEHYWGLCEYEGLEGWICLTDASILRGEIQEVLQEPAQEAVPVIILTSRKGSLRLVKEPNSTKVAAVVKEGELLHFFEEIQPVPGTGVSWYKVYTPDGSEGWIRSNRLIMASAAAEQTADSGASLTQTAADALPGAWKDLEGGRILKVERNQMEVILHDPETWEELGRESFYYIRRPLHNGEGPEVRIVAYGLSDSSEVWILLYDPARPDRLKEEYYSGAAKAEELTGFSRAENQ